MESIFERNQLKMKNQALELKLAEKALEIEQLSSKLEEANAGLLELEAMKSDFLSIISHEVRTSLNGILGSILLIRDKLPDNRFSILFDILVSSASRLEKFSLTALSITELKTGVRKYTPTGINLDALIREILISFHPVSRQKGISFNLAGISRELEICGDRDLLAICFTSIIENAVKYSPAGGIITIFTEQKNNTLTCIILDEGPGFSETALRHLFKLFSPGEPHIDQNIGLDLSLARLIMEAHSGKIEVENLQGGGAGVRLVFPGCGVEGYCY